MIKLRMEEEDMEITKDNNLFMRAYDAVMALSSDLKVGMRIQTDVGVDPYGE